MEKVQNTCVPTENVVYNERLTKLCKVFNQEFNAKPSFIVKVPGRVNIIGEHIDYCGYPVLPMALEQNILIAVQTHENPEVYISNVNKKYESHRISFTTSEDIEIIPDPTGKPYWYNYVLCGIKGALEYLDDQLDFGLNLLIDGNVPPGSGLSSSSALISATFLAFIFAQDKNLPKTEIATLCAKSERYIGTQGGGMDQAIAFLAEKCCAQYITFNPLSTSPVVLPENAAFVVAHSLIVANKAATNDFNRRVIECRLAARLLAKLSDVKVDTKKAITLSEIQNRLNKSLEDMVQLVKIKLPKDVYTKDDICNMLDMSVEDVDKFVMTANTKELTEFKLKQRSLHVYEEAMRVEKFRHICNDPKGNTNHNINSYPIVTNENGDHISEDILSALGNLLSESHESLKTLYECSHHNLDRLVDISKEVNAYARLTGAGWGGCIVALCHKDKVSTYIEKLKNEYYRKQFDFDNETAENYVFATTPHHGAVIYINIQ